MNQLNLPACPICGEFVPELYASEGHSHVFGSYSVFYDYDLDEDCDEYECWTIVYLSSVLECEGSGEWLIDLKGFVELDLERIEKLLLLQ